MRIDLNSDVGESFGVYSLGLDKEVAKYVTSFNIACGYHAGDPMVMAETVRIAKAHDIGIGAHPGYPDLQGFGRRVMHMTPEEVTNAVMYQIGALQAFAQAQNRPLQHVKAHGTLYNMAAKDPKLAAAIAKGVKAVAPDAILVGLAGSELIKEALAAGLKVAQEVFADRAYNADGTLVPRSEPGAMIHDAGEAAKRVVRMLTEGKVTAIDGTEIAVAAHSVCVHGDNPAAIAFVKQIREALVNAGVEVVPLAQVLSGE